MHDWYCETMPGAAAMTLIFPPNVRLRYCAAASVPAELMPTFLDAAEMVGASRSTAGATLHPTEARRIGNQQQRDVIALVNPVAPTRDLVWAPDTGATMRQVTPAPGTQTNAALAGHLYEQGRVMRVAPPQEPSVFSSLMSALALSSGVPAIDMYAPYQPKPVPPAMMTSAFASVRC